MKIPTLKSDVQAFECPHCGAYAGQQWFELYASSNIFLEPKASVPPSLVGFENSISLAAAQKENQQVELLRERIVSGEVFVNSVKKYKSIFGGGRLENAKVSRCQACNEIAVWVRDKLVHPAVRYNVAPNPDMPDDIMADYLEAAEIVESSPRGAAALLRLAIQKLCDHLEAKGRNINDQIGYLVGQGLSVRIQQALDVVRVIGNECVHPGELDLKDDKKIAKALFDLINVIVDDRISSQKKIQAMYDRLPQKKREGIEARNKKVKQD